MTVINLAEHRNKLLSNGTLCEVLEKYSPYVYNKKEVIMVGNFITPEEVKENKAKHQNKTVNMRQRRY
jgi:precorrin-4 methylase